MIEEDGEDIYCEKLLKTNLRIDKLIKINNLLISCKDELVTSHDSRLRYDTPMTLN